MNKEHKDPDVIHLDVPRLGTSRKYGRNIKTRCIGLTSNWLKRKDWSSIRRNRTPSFFMKHSQPIVSRRLSWWNLEKSKTRMYMRHLDLLRRFPWNMTGWKNWVQKLLEVVKTHNKPNQKPKIQLWERWDLLRVSNPSGSLTHEIDKGVLFDCKSTFVRTGRPVKNGRYIGLFTQREEIPFARKWLEKCVVQILLFFELIKTLMTVIQCGFNFFEFIKTVMGTNSLARHFFLKLQTSFSFFSKKKKWHAQKPTTQPTTQRRQHTLSHTNTCSHNQTQPNTNEHRQTQTHNPFPAQDGDKHSVIWGMCMSSTLQASVFMGRTTQTVYIHQIYRRSHKETVFDISEKLITEQSDEIYGVKTMNLEDSSWKY